MLSGKIQHSNLSGLQPKNYLGPAQVQLIYLASSPDLQQKTANSIRVQLDVPDGVMSEKQRQHMMSGSRGKQNESLASSVSRVPSALSQPPPFPAAAVAQLLPSVTVPDKKLQNISGIISTELEPSQEWKAEIKKHHQDHQEFQLRQKRDLKGLQDKIAAAEMVLVDLELCKMAVVRTGETEKERYKKAETAMLEKELQHQKALEKERIANKVNRDMEDQLEQYKAQLQRKAEEHKAKLLREAEERARIRLENHRQTLPGLSQSVPAS